MPLYKDRLFVGRCPRKLSQVDKPFNLVMGHCVILPSKLRGTFALRSHHSLVIRKKSGSELNMATLLAG